MGQRLHRLAVEGNTKPLRTPITRPFTSLRRPSELLERRQVNVRIFSLGERSHF